MYALPVIHAQHFLFIPGQLEVYKGLLYQYQNSQPTVPSK